MSGGTTCSIKHLCLSGQARPRPRRKSVGRALAASAASWRSGRKTWRCAPGALSSSGACRPRRMPRRRCLRGSGTRCAACCCPFRSCCSRRTTRRSAPVSGSHCPRRSRSSLSSRRPLPQAPRSGGCSGPGSSAARCSLPCPASPLSTLWAPAASSSRSCARPGASSGSLLRARPSLVSAPQCATPRRMRLEPRREPRPARMRPPATALLWAPKPRGPRQSRGPRKQGRLGGLRQPPVGTLVVTAAKKRCC
mmetsp:Transcript_87953/g.284742  ORF Transcript_87953/g.284742 Transcript_87953/m.284742 type:complete len:251 (+) Transcript_87953:1965-2717(+)